MKINLNSKLFNAPIAIALLALPFIIDALFGHGWVRITDFALLYIMLALGLNIVVGYAGLLDLGYIAFYAVGAYTYALLGSPQFGIHLPMYVVSAAGRTDRLRLRRAARRAHAQVCAATTSPSSPSVSARSSASSSTT